MDDGKDVRLFCLSMVFLVTALRGFGTMHVEKGARLF